MPKLIDVESFSPDEIATCRDFLAKMELKTKHRGDLAFMKSSEITSFIKENLEEIFDIMEIAQVVNISSVNTSWAEGFLREVVRAAQQVVYPKLNQ